MNLIRFFFKNFLKKLFKLFFSLFSLFFPLSVPDPALARENQKEGKMTQLLLKTHLVKSRGAKKLWELKADKVSQEKDGDQWQLDQITSRFFRKNGESYKITGLTGFLDKLQKKLKIEGDIKILSSNGFILTTSEILYEEQKEQVTGLKPVEIKAFSEDEEKLFLLKGDSFRMDMKTNTVELKANIYGEKQLSNNRLMKIKSESARFEADSNDIFFNKSVVVSVESFEITGPQAKFKYKNGKLQSLFMSEGVTIKDARRSGRAKEIEILFTKDQIVLKGNPKLTQGGDRVMGSEIIIFDGGNRIRVKKARTRYNTKKRRN